MNKKSGYERLKENYYKVSLYFSSEKENEVSLYYFINILSRRKKATVFITRLISEYLELCGVTDPAELKYEDIIKLPSIKEIFGRAMFKSIIENGEMSEEKQAVHQEKPQEKKVAPKITEEVYEHDVNTATDMTQSEIEEERVFDDDNFNLDNSWLRGLTGFMGEQ